MYTIIIAILVLMLAALLDVSYFENIVQPDIQIVLGILVVGVTMFDHFATGLILGIAVLLMYLRVYVRKYGIALDFWNMGGKKSGGKYPMKSLVNDYITAQNLKDAQNNKFDEKNYDTELIGVKGVYGEAVYGAQGTGSNNPGLPGMDKYPPVAELSFR
jgi:hypothetical protein